MKHVISSGKSQMMLKKRSNTLSCCVYCVRWGGAFRHFLFENALLIITCSFRRNLARTRSRVDYPLNLLFTYYCVLANYTEN